MPISACDGCAEQHWSEVKGIVYDAVDAVGFLPSLVSEAEEIGVIQKRIIQNIYEMPVVVCDVSGKNPNVMLELGMRLAFDKPTIIIKDDKTPYSFDTAPIEHITYPRDLRFAKIVEFKKSLGEKVRATHSKATSDPTYTTFLKHFGTFKVASLETSEISKEEFILQELRDLRSLIVRREAREPSVFSDFSEKWRRSSVVNPATVDRVRSMLAKHTAGMPETVLLGSSAAEMLAQNPEVERQVLSILFDQKPRPGAVTSDDIISAVRMALAN